MAGARLTVVSGHRRSYKSRMITNSFSTLYSQSRLRIIVSVLAASSMAAWVLGQTAPPPSPAPAVARQPIEPAAAKVPKPEETKPAVDVTEAVLRGRTIIDEIDANLADIPSRESLDELEKIINDVQAAEPANPWLPYLLGRAYELSGRKGDAIDQLRKFVGSREGRNEWKAYRVLGDLFVEEFPRLAQGNYEKAVELNPNEPSVLTGLSNCANRSGNLDEGLRLARQAAEADGYKNVRYAYRLARALIGKKQFDEAEKEAMKALAIAEGRVQKNPGKRVSLQILMDQYDLLIELASARILNSPTVDTENYMRVAEYTGTKADIAHRLAKHDQVTILESAIKRCGTDVPVALREKYAAHLAEAGRETDAIAEYEKVLSADPQNKEAKEALARLNDEQKRTPQNP